MPTVVLRPTQIRTQAPALTTPGCFCLNTSFLTTSVGLCKIGQLLFGSISLSLILTYGTPVWILLGLAYPLFFSVSSASLLGSSVYMLSYLLSSHTYNVVRSTWLEVLQNAACCILFGLGSGFLMLQTSLFLWPMYLIIPYFQAYPALISAGVCGSVCSLLHGIDSIMAFRSRVR